jgi:peptidoglycan/xylan/chitin deacetylase (PgdA/CDA1 family)
MRLLIAAVLMLIAGSASAERRVAFTFDDLPGLATPCDLGAYDRLNRKLVAAITRNGIPATGLVVDSRLCARQQQHLPALYNIWLDAGLELGNHTRSHRDLNEVPLEAFQADVIAGETTLGPLLAARGRKIRYFRYPFLRSATEIGKKRAFEEFLRRRGYEKAPVTIDNDEYIYAAVYDAASAAGDRDLTARIADDYGRYMESIFAFYEDLSRSTLGYELPQVLLLHANALNADHLDRIVHIARQRGYQFISLETALRDPAYARRDAYVGRRGLSWLHRWALDAGKPAPAHPAVPGWVMQLYRRR